MNILRKMLQKERREEEIASSISLENGKLVLEELITCFNGKHKIPIRSFTAKELIMATNNFADCVMVCEGDFFSGSFEQRPILVKRYKKEGSVYDKIMINHDIVITAQMSCHKNVLKLLGCCLEYELPALVYEYLGSERLYDILQSTSRSNGRLLSWRIRLRIANEIANAIVYLHTAFSTPIIHRDVKPFHIIIDQNGDAKLFDFSLCISLPPGEMQVEDAPMGTASYIDPEYLSSGIVTQKADVYGFGVLLLVLLTGREAVHRDLGGTLRGIVDYVNGYVDKNQFNEIVDPKMLGEMGGTYQQQQLQAFLALALACTEKGGNRPKMFDVAKELQRIERSIPLSQFN